MTITEAFVIFAAITTILFVLAFLAARRGWLRLSPNSELEMKVSGLNRELAKERADREELERRVDFLVQELQRAGARIHELETQVLELSHPREARPSLPAKPLLLICGVDEELCVSDRQALRRANIPFQRLIRATKASIAAELRRRRQNGNLYPWLHVTAHAGPAGVALADGIADPSWWHEQLDGISVVFLAACETSAVADALAGLVTVVFVHEEIDNRDAADFTYAFWRRMLADNNAGAAYDAAIAEVPAVSEFTDIRSH